MRLHQLNFICNRIRQEYQTIGQNLEEDKIQDENKELNSHKGDSGTEDSFLSADMSEEDNNLMAVNVKADKGVALVDLQLNQKGWTRIIKNINFIL